MADLRVQRFLQLLTNNGFVHETPVAVNGIQKKLFRFGPLGVLLKKNIIKQWWDSLVIQQPNAFTVESPPLMLPGDMPVVDLDYNDILPLSESSNHSMSISDLRFSLSKDCSGAFLSSLNMANGQLPISLASIGQCFSLKESETDIGAKKLLANGLCEEHLLFQHYAPPVNMAQTLDYWIRARLSWWKRFSSNPSNLKTSSLPESVTAAHEGNGNTSITYNFPWGTESVETVINQGDSFIRDMESRTGLSHQGKYHQKNFHPCLIECHTTVERCMAVFLIDAFRESQPQKTLSAKDVQNMKMVLQIHPLLSPYQVGLSVSGTRTREVRVLTEHVAKELRTSGISVLCLPGNSESMESQYRRNDQFGVPFTVILSDQTLDSGIITLRNRDTSLKQQHHISSLQEILFKNLRVANPS